MAKDSQSKACWLFSPEFVRRRVAGPTGLRAYLTLLCNTQPYHRADTHSRLPSPWCFPEINRKTSAILSPGRAPDNLAFLVHPPISSLGTSSSSIPGSYPNQDHSLSFRPKRSANQSNLSLVNTSSVSACRLRTHLNSTPCINVCRISDHAVLTCQHIKHHYCLPPASAFERAVHNLEEAGGWRSLPTINNATDHLSTNPAQPRNRYAFPERIRSISPQPRSIHSRNAIPLTLISSRAAPKPEKADASQCSTKTPVHQPV
jgi:hypothetical protein